MKAKYDWKESVPVYEVFKIMYSEERTDSETICAFRNTAPQTTSDILRVLKDLNLIEEEIEGRNKFFSLNKEKLKKILKVSNLKKIEPLIFGCKNFRELIKAIPDKPQTNIMNAAFDEVITKMPKQDKGIFYTMAWLEYVDKLQKENAELKKQLKKA